MSAVQQKPFYPPFFTKYGQFTKGASQHRTCIPASAVSCHLPMLTFAASPFPPCSSLQMR